MDRDQLIKDPQTPLQGDLSQKLDVIIRRLEDQQEAIEELTEKINDAMIDRYGTGYSQG